MKLFARALKEALRHWVLLALALLCSIGAAALWGANIGAIFPIIQTTLHGESLQSWNRDRIADAQGSVDRLQAQISKTELQSVAKTSDQNAASPELRARRRAANSTIRSRFVSGFSRISIGFFQQSLFPRCC